MLAFIREKKVICIVGAALIVAAGVLVGMVLSNSDQPVAAGQKVVVSIVADSYENMYGYQFDLHYDETKLEFPESSSGSRSNLEELSFFFPKEMGGYVLVGSTMTGDEEGVSGRNKVICELVFTALQDGMLSEFEFGMERVNVVQVVQSDLEYIEGIEGWQYKLSVQDQ